MVAKHEGNYAVIESLLDESKFFIEWTAHDAEIETAAALVDLQIRLASWQRRLHRVWPDPMQRAKLMEESRHWSTETLNRSGLLS